MHGSADGVTRNVRKIQSLSEYALSSECAVTVHQQWQELLDAALACAIFFFFSSRRRHTRFDCDWSSDVCSSDLPPEEAIKAESAWPAVERALASALNH